MHAWGSRIVHLPGQKFYDFKEIRGEIISSQPINLRICSPNVLTLTLIDLPGLTKVRIGNQTEATEYISRPTCLILVVIDANTMMAKEVDPEGRRTIGILTKVDLIDSREDVIDILACRKIPLLLGYIPVVNCGQQDIKISKTISQALDNEHQFFMNHRSYKGKIEYCGTPFIIRKLNMFFMHHIRATTVPDIKARITQQRQKFNAELQTLGSSAGDSGDLSDIILSIITEFAAEFRLTIEGPTNDLSSKELAGGARINFVLNELFSSSVKRIEPFDQVKDGDIRKILRNLSSSTLSSIVRITAFEVIIKQQIKRLEGPGLECCRIVYDEFIRILGQLLAKMQVFRQYPVLRERFNSVVINFFKKTMGPTTKLVSDLVAMQTCYINTTHPDFIVSGITSITSHDNSLITGGPGLLRLVFCFTGEQHTKYRGNRLDERETLRSRTASPLIFRHRQARGDQHGPQSYLFDVVSFSKENLQRELLRELYKPEVPEGLLKESEIV
ncbi:Dynamin central region-domain-containing protein [Infundibulicybe gibba]|nr:Dynamin central region-domain-containing protein [Infundibulicybe gibba]